MDSNAASSADLPGEGELVDLRKRFPELVPKKPYCVDDFSCGISIRPRSTALKSRHIQFNEPWSFRWMVHDIDDSSAYFAHRDSILPQPNIIAINPENGHAHSAYLLETPVARHSMSRLAPLKFYALVERGIRRRLGADRNYGGLLAKNPLHADWRVEWRHEKAYSLRDLEGHLFEWDMRPDPTPEIAFGAGRNVALFDQLRSIAYREILEFKRVGAEFNAWKARCLGIAVARNKQFCPPMNTSEVRAIANSVAKWTWPRFSLESFSEIQTVRSKRAARARTAKSNALRDRIRGLYGDTLLPQTRLLPDMGGETRCCTDEKSWTGTSISKALNVPRSTVYRHLAALRRESNSKD